MEAIHVATYIGFNQRIKIEDTSAFMKSPNWFSADHFTGDSTLWVVEKLDEQFMDYCEWLKKQIEKFKVELETNADSYSHLAFVHGCLDKYYTQLDALVGSAEEEEDTI